MWKSPLICLHIYSKSVSYIDLCLRILFQNVSHAYEDSCVFALKNSIINITLHWSEYFHIIYVAISWPKVYNEFRTAFLGVPHYE